MGRNTSEGHKHRWIIPLMIENPRLAYPASYHPGSNQLAQLRIAHRGMGAESDQIIEGLYLWAQQFLKITEHPGHRGCAGTIGNSDKDALARNWHGLSGLDHNLSDCGIIEVGICR